LITAASRGQDKVEGELLPTAGTRVGGERGNSTLSFLFSPQERSEGSLHAKREKRREHGAKYLRLLI